MNKEVTNEIVLALKMLAKKDENFNINDCVNMLDEYLNGNVPDIIKNLASENTIQNVVIWLFLKEVQKLLEKEI